MCMVMYDMDHSGHGAQTSQTSAPQQESLLDILKRRYALGEITLDQFAEVKHVLGLSGSAMKVAS